MSFSSKVCGDFIDYIVFITFKEGNILVYVRFRYGFFYEDFIIFYIIVILDVFDY